MLLVACGGSPALPRLPPFVGDMKGLRMLLLGNNKLEALPYKLGFCTEMKELQLYNNPLVRFLFPHECGLTSLQHDAPTPLRKRVQITLLNTLHLPRRDPPPPQHLVSIACFSSLIFACQVDPPYESVLAGVDGLMYDLRQRFLEAVQGPTPDVSGHK